MSHDGNPIADDRAYRRIIRVTEASGAQYERIQDALDIHRRARDGAENLARGRLLLARLGELAAQPLDLIFPARDGPFLMRTCRSWSAFT